MCRQDEAGFPQKQLETAFLHSLRLLEQNREYLLQLFLFEGAFQFFDPFGKIRFVFCHFY